MPSARPVPVYDPWVPARDLPATCGSTEWPSLEESSRIKSALGLPATAESELRIEDGRWELLDSRPDQPSLFVPRRITTPSIDIFRSWMSLGDASAADSLRWPLPTRPAAALADRDRAGLTSAELADLDRAYWAYVYGGVEQAAEYRPLLERFYAPFEAVVYQIARVELRPHSSLIVRGEPSILLFDDLILHPEARLALHVPCKVVLGRLEKRSLHPQQVH
jgi:hypothetical protein